MRASEFIKLLQRKIEENGDLVLVANGPFNPTELGPVDGVDVVDLVLSYGEKEQTYFEVSVE